MTEEELLALIQYLISSGVNPSASSGIVPQDPDALDFKRDAQNSYQDSEQILTSLLTGALAGPGAFDYRTFEPSYERGDEVVREGETLLNYYLNRGDGSWRRIVAEEIQGGGDAASAFAVVQSILQGEPTNEEEAAIQQQLQQSIPQQMDFATGESIGPDIEKVWSFAEDLEQKVALDPNFDIQDPVSGRYYNVNEIPSEAAKFFQDQGLPLPTDRYTEEEVGGDRLAKARVAYRERSGGVSDLEKQIAELTQNLNQAGRSNFLQQIQGSPTGGASQPAAAPQPTDQGGGGILDRLGLGGLGDAFSNLAPRSTPDVRVTGSRRTELPRPIPEFGQPSLANQVGQKLDTQTRGDAVMRKMLEAQLKLSQRARGEDRRNLIDEQARTRGRMDAIREYGQSPLLDALMARRMQGFAAGLGG